MYMHVQVFVSFIIINQALAEYNQLFQFQVHDILAKGSVLDETLMAEIIHRKLESLETQHYGTVNSTPKATNICTLLHVLCIIL